MSRLATEAKKLTRLLAGKVVGTVTRHRNAEVLIEFTDGTRLFIDCTATGPDFSVTGGQPSN